MNHLLFQLYGPMAAWGDTAIGEFRPTASYPSKSAIIGLLAAARGIVRSQDDWHRRLAETLGFAVQVRNPGELLRDYHTTQVPPASRKSRYFTRQDELLGGKIATILSTRDYRSDAWSVVALWQIDGGSDELERLQGALLQPRFSPYLGRKSCPASLPLQPQLVAADSLADAFDRVEFGGDEELQTLQLPYCDIHWDAHPAHGFDRVLHRSRRKDRILSRQRWQFADREEFMTRRRPPCS